MQIRPLAAAAVMLADVAVDSYVLLTRILVGWLYGCARLTMTIIIRIWTACDHAIASNFSWQARAVHQRADGEEVLAARLPRDAARRHDTEAAEEGVLPGHAARGFAPEHERLARPADRTTAHRVSLPVRRPIGAAQVALLLLSRPDGDMPRQAATRASARATCCRGGGDTQDRALSDHGYTWSHTYVTRRRLLFAPYTPYLPGDGHDVVWPKAVELLLSIPFTLGFRTRQVSRLLAASLVLEALYAWSWWRIDGDGSPFAQHRRALHYREHFMTNLATAGGLLLLQMVGAGKYTVDELLKKKE